VASAARTRACSSDGGSGSSEHGLLGGVEGRLGVAHFPPVSPEPLQPPGPVHGCGRAHSGERVCGPGSGLAWIARPACGPRCLFQQVRPALWPPVDEFDGQGVVLLRLGETLVQEAPLRRDNLGVDGLADQRVGERVSVGGCGQRPVGQRRPGHRCRLADAHPRTVSGRTAGQLLHQPGLADTCLTGDQYHPMRVCVAWEIRTWPPRATAQIRAARWTARPV
jgi:hypothetical protein